MRRNFLEDIGAVKTARREKESLLLAKTVLQERRLQGKTPEGLVRLAIHNKVTLRAAPLLNLSSQVVNEAKSASIEAFELYDLMSKTFDGEDLQFVVIKSFDSLPDIGHDIDFLVPAKTDLDRAKALLVDKFGARSLRLTHCDKVVGKFSCFLNGYKHDFELYPTVSQQGEQHFDPAEVIKNRKKRIVNGRNVWLTSDRDRVLIRVVHAMFRHNFLKLSDILDFLSLIRECSAREVVESADEAGIEDAFVFYMATIDRFLVACQVEDSCFEELQREAENRFGPDRLRLLRRDRLVLPYRIPTLALVIIFLLKAGREIARGRLKSALRCLTAPALLLVHFANSVFDQKLLKRIW